ncbi:MAG TPA: ArsR family transcriptional regulator [Actinomycetota bacterium]
MKADVATVQREVSRLERAGILKSNRIGKTRLVAANTSSPLYRSLSELALRTFGPAQVVAEEFDEIQGVDETYIFGSWAARYQGIEGPFPVDVDVLVVGSVDRDEAYEAATRAERRLRRPVNVTIRSKAGWDAARDGFIRQVRSSPLVSVIGSKIAEA